MNRYKPHISSIGDTAANLIAAACYVFLLVFWTFGIVIILAIFLAEKKSGLVRFHAMQAALLWVVRLAVGAELPFESLASVLTGNMQYMMSDMGWEAAAGVIAFRMAASLLLTLTAAFCVVYAFRWRILRVPFVGQLALLISEHSRQPAYVGGEVLPEVCEVPLGKKELRALAKAEKAERVLAAQAAEMAGGQAGEPQGTEAPPELTAVEEVPAIPASLENTSELVKNIYQQVCAYKEEEAPLWEDVELTAELGTGLVGEALQAVEATGDGPPAGQKDAPAPAGKTAGKTVGKKKAAWHLFTWAPPVPRQGDPNAQLPQGMRDPPLEAEFTPQVPSGTEELQHEKQLSAFWQEDGDYKPQSGKAGTGRAPAKASGRKVRAVRVKRKVDATDRDPVFDETVVAGLHLPAIERLLNRLGQPQRQAVVPEPGRERTDRCLPPEMRDPPRLADMY